MKKNKISKIMAIIISILVLIIFIGIFGYLAQMFFKDISIRNNIIILLFYLAIISVPLLVSIKFLILMLNGKTKVSTSIISQLILIPLSLIYLFVAIFIIGIVTTMVPVRNYQQYKNLYNGNNELIKDFPSDIPSDAYDIKFYYQPPFLQSGKVMNLYYKVNDTIVNEYKEKYEKIELNEYEIDIENLDKLYLDEFKLDDNYRLYFLYSRCDDSGYCNHGAYSYVAINEISNEVIFAMYEW